MSKLKCPQCGSEKINQYRMMTGPIWCEICGFRVEQKEINNPFISREDSEQVYLFTEWKRVCSKMEMLIVFIQNDFGRMLEDERTTNQDLVSGFKEFNFQYDTNIRRLTELRNSINDLFKKYIKE